MRHLGQFWSVRRTVEYAETIVTGILSRSQVKQDMEALVDRCARLGVEQVQVLFGFAWGADYRDWQTVTMPPSELPQEVQAAEAATHGALGADDLWIESRGAWRVQYCHEGDIHISYSGPSPFVQDSIESWRAKGWLGTVKK